VTARAPFFVSTLAVAAVFGLTSHGGLSEPMNGADVGRSPANYDKKASASGVPTPPRISARDSAKVVSATRQFDLAKLTLADFGDVEPAR
jgi:hypothetical protein